MSSTDPILVAAGIVLQEGRILIGRRPLHCRYGGVWEFPGGKLRETESAIDAATRELREEIGILANASEIVHRCVNRFSDGGEFDVSYVAVTDYAGTPIPIAHSELLWVTPSTLSSFTMLEGNTTIVQLIGKGLLDRFLLRT